MRYLGIVAALLMALSASGQDDVHIVPHDKPVPSLSTEPSNPNTIKVNVNLALVPVTVTDWSGKPFPGLVQGHFRLWYDGKEQPIKYFSEDDAPASIGLILDRSGSMGMKVEQAKAIVAAFAEEANPQDEMFIITFADTIDATDFTTVTEEIQNRTLFLDSKGRTSMLDALYLAVKKMKNAKYQRRALILITDGGDNHSRYTEHELGKFIEETDVTLYTIGLFEGLSGCQWFQTSHGMDSNCPQELMRAPLVLHQLAEKTGGGDYKLEKPEDIRAAVRGVGYYIRQQYLLGFTIPNVGRDTKYHKVKVKLQRLPKNTPPLSVHVREGMYAGTE